MYWVRMILLVVFSLPFAILLDHQTTNSLAWWLPVGYIGAHSTLTVVFLACAGRFADGISTIVALRAPYLVESAPSLGPSPSPNVVWGVVFGQVIIIAGVSIAVMPHINHAPLRVILLTIAIASLAAAISNMILCLAASGKNVSIYKEYVDADSNLWEQEDRISECIDRVKDALRSHRKSFYRDGILDEETKSKLREIPGLSRWVYNPFGCWDSERSGVSGVLNELQGAKFTTQIDRDNLIERLDRQTNVFSVHGLPTAAHRLVGLGYPERTPHQRSSSMAHAALVGGQLVGHVVALPVAIGLTTLIGAVLPTDSYSLQGIVIAFLLSFWNVYGYRLWRAPTSLPVSSETDVRRCTARAESGATEEQVGSVSDRTSKTKASAKGRKKRASSRKKRAKKKPA